MTQEPGVGPELDIATVLDAIAARHPDTETLTLFAEQVMPSFRSGQDPLR